MVKQMLIKKSAPHPFSRKTPRGGRMMAKMILQMSLYKRYISMQTYKKIGCINEELSSNYPATADELIEQG